ncbi:A-kinase anchor protein 10, mitochondrial-like isoform X2 [Ctenocephalides felis]|uniref:A-kinase anchor protein 10, mitochondrial-like isoform X2 n=1 Tax=Ctenocephalides felis TaxID=7515 RepID=UPI000E6E25C7|nr:A-kinase anchor protein 10, mitochondrial-like isoform X2 [Ctenocephalides felis]
MNDGPYKPRSRLSKTLREVLIDKDALGYFIQFMDSKSVVALIKFWLDVESFRSAATCTDENDGMLLSPEDRSIMSSISADLNSPIDHFDDVFDSISIKAVENNCSKPLDYKSEQCFLKNGNRKRRTLSCQSDISKVEDDNISASTDCDSLYLTGESENDNKSTYKTIESENEFTSSNKILGSVHSLQTDVFQTGRGAHKECANGFDCMKLEIKRTYSVPQDFEDNQLTRTISMNSLKKRKDFYSSIHQDAMRISKKYICENAPYHIKLPDTIRSEVLNKIQSNTIEPEMFTPAQELVFMQIENNYFTHFLRSDFNTKHQIDVLTSGNVILEDILFNETALFHFMEYLEQESPVNRDFIEFWLSAVNFRQTAHYDNEQMQSDAMTLYDKYFSLQALNPLNLGDKVRFHVEQNICREEGPAITCFDLPLKIVQNYLEKNYLKPFLMSQLFFKYLNELINSINTNPWPKFGHRKSGSDASSEISVTNSTVHKNCKNKSKDKFDMSIETRSMTDPDSLWRRKQCGLKFGHVNNLGRFQSDLEREPESKSNWRLSKAMKRFVNKKDVTKEEIAWQVAEMIVKDITSLTLNHEFNDDPS